MGERHAASGASRPLHAIPEVVLPNLEEDKLKFKHEKGTKTSITWDSLNIQEENLKDKLKLKHER